MSTNLTLRKIDNSAAAFGQLVALQTRCANLRFEEVQVSLDGWFAANDCSLLGALLYDIKDRLNTVTVVPGQAADILRRNGFMAHFGENKVEDVRNTAVSYQELAPSDDRYFNNYVFRELLSRDELPTMTDALKRRLAMSIYEIFINAKMHSGTRRIFTCGQSFPQKKVIEFMVTDTGIGIQASVNGRYGSTLGPMQAIDWAMEPGHTTKQGTPGGLGLALLKEFISLNGGKIQIVSGNAFWELNRGEIARCNLGSSFRGTVVNLYVRTDDPAHYALAEEPNTGVF